MSLTAEIYEEAKGRIVSQTEIIFNLLTEAGEKGVTNRRLSEITSRFGTPIYNLRLQGFDIKTENLGGGLVKYTMSDKILPVKKHVKGADVIAEAINNQYKGVVTTEQLMKIMDEQGMNFFRKPDALRGER